MIKRLLLIRTVRISMRVRGVIVMRIMMGILIRPLMLRRLMLLLLVDVGLEWLGTGVRFVFGCLLSWGCTGLM